MGGGEDRGGDTSRQVGGGGGETSRHGGWRGGEDRGGCGGSGPTTRMAWARYRAPLLGKGGGCERERDMETEGLALMARTTGKIALAKLAGLN